MGFTLVTNTFGSGDEHFSAGDEQFSAGDERVENARSNFSHTHTQLAIPTTSKHNLSRIDC